MIKSFEATALGTGFLMLFLLATAETTAVTRTGQAAASAKDIPRTSWDGKPDLTGVWQGQKLTPSAYGLAQLERLYQPSAIQKMKVLAEKNDPIENCVVYGYPRRMATGFPIQILQAVGVMVLFDNRPHVYRYIPTDGRQHTDDLFPSYQGDSVGRWDGDTLVVDMSTFNGRFWLAGAKDHLAANITGGWITSDALHVVERWRLAEPNTLEYQATVEDSNVLTGPWTTPKIVLKRLPAQKLADEGHCIPKGIDYKSPALN